MTWLRKCFGNAAHGSHAAKTSLTIQILGWLPALRYVAG
jgi:hypothetical protein